MIISSPEYARGVPGSLKAALDWLVGDMRSTGKRVALLNTSPRAHHAQDALALILQTMSARLVRQAFAQLPLLSRDLDADAIAGDRELAGTLARSLAC